MLSYVKKCNFVKKVVLHRDSRMVAMGEHRIIFKVAQQIVLYIDVFCCAIFIELRKMEFLKLE